MALQPAAAAAPADDMADDAAPAPDDAAAPDTGGDDETAPGDENVLFTVCKEDDGTYSLIKGDEEDASGADTAGSADMEEAGADDNKQIFDGPGPLLKAILDLLKEDMSSAGAPGSADDQFQSGFDESAPPAPAKPAAMSQKF